VRAIPALIDLKDDTDDDVRTYAACALGEIGKDSEVVVAPLVGFLSDRESSVRSAAWVALANVGEKAMPVMLKGFESPDAMVRERAAFAVGRMCKPDASYDGVKVAVSGLVKLLADKDATVRQSAAYAFGMMGDNLRDAAYVSLTSL